MQYKNNPLGGGQALEHNQERWTDRVGEECFIFGIDAGTSSDLVGRACPKNLFAP